MCGLCVNSERNPHGMAKHPAIGRKYEPGQSLEHAVLRYQHSCADCVEKGAAQAVLTAQ